MAVRKMNLVLKNDIVHLPELILRTRSFGRNSGMHGIGMGIGQRKIPENEFQVIPQLLLDMLDEWIGAPAMRTLIISILHQFDPCILRSLKMILCVYGRF